MAAGGTLHGAQDYALQRPTREDLLEALLRSPDRRQAVAAWQVSCRRLGHSPSGPLSDEALEDLAVDLLRGMVGPAVLAVRSFLIRLRTVNALEGDPRQ